MNTSFENRLFENCGLPAVMGLFPSIIVDTNGKTIRSGVESRLEIHNLPRQLNRATLTLALYASEHENSDIFQGSTCRVSNCKAVLPFMFTRGPVYVNLSVTTQAGEELARIDALTVDSSRAELVNEIRVNYAKNDVSFTPYEDVLALTSEPTEPSQKELVQELTNLEELSRVLSHRIRSLSFAMQDIEPRTTSPLAKLGHSKVVELDQSALENAQSDLSPVA